MLAAGCYFAKAKQALGSRVREDPPRSNSAVERDPLRLSSEVKSGKFLTGELLV